MDDSRTIHTIRVGGVEAVQLPPAGTPRRRSRDRCYHEVLLTPPDCRTPSLPATIPPGHDIVGVRLLPPSAEPLLLPAELTGIRLSIGNGAACIVWDREDLLCAGENLLASALCCESTEKDLPVLPISRAYHMHTCLHFCYDADALTARAAWEPHLELEDEECDFLDAETGRVRRGRMVVDDEDVVAPSSSSACCVRVPEVEIQFVGAGQQRAQGKEDSAVVVAFWQRLAAGSGEPSGWLRSRYEVRAPGGAGAWQVRNQIRFQGGIAGVCLAI